MEERVSTAGEIEVEKDKGIYVGVEEDGDDQTKTEDDGLGNIWQEMSMALEISKVFCIYYFPFSFIYSFLLSLVNSIELVLVISEDRVY